MLYALVYFAGVITLPVGWWLLGFLHDCVYMPLIWIPRHHRAIERMRIVEKIMED